MANNKDNKAFDMMTAAADKTNVKIHAVKPPEKKYDSASMHMTLAGSGFLPGPTGMAADFADAMLYFSEGKSGEAILAGLSVLPGGSLLFRGVGGTKQVLQSFKFAGKHLPGTDVKKLVGNYEKYIHNDFRKSTALVGSGKHSKAMSSTWGDAPDITFTTTNVVEASKRYGKFFRLEVDPKILNILENSNLLKKFPGGRSASGFGEASHYIFREGIKLKDIKDLRLFQTYPDYVKFMAKKYNIPDHKLWKFLKQYDDYPK